jgi:hypothetical protein
MSDGPTERPTLETDVLVGPPRPGLIFTWGPGPVRAGDRALRFEVVTEGAGVGLLGCTVEATPAPGADPDILQPSRRGPLQRLGWSGGALVPIGGVEPELLAGARAFVDSAPGLLDAAHRVALSIGGPNLLPALRAGGWGPGLLLALHDLAPLEPELLPEPGGLSCQVEPLFCVNPRCDCQDALLEWGALQVSADSALIGTVTVDLRRRVVTHVDGAGAQSPRLERLSAALLSDLGAVERLRQWRSRARAAVQAALSPPLPPLAAGRNTACPCGSGKKYKVCCLGKPVAPPSTVARMAAASRSLSVALGLDGTESALDRARATLSPRALTALSGLGPAELDLERRLRLRVGSPFDPYEVDEQGQITDLLSGRPEAVEVESPVRPGTAFLAQRIDLDGEVTLEGVVPELELTRLSPLLAALRGASRLGRLARGPALLEALGAAG